MDQKLQQKYLSPAKSAREAVSTITHNTIDSPENHIISHSIEHTDLPRIIGQTKERILASQEWTLPQEKTLSMLDDLVQFPLGRFILENKGLDGYWTAYCLLHAPNLSLVSHLEDWLINKAPVLRATRERFYIFQKQLKKYAEKRDKIASVPSGLMDNLLLFAHDNKNLELLLTGIDGDPTSLTKGQEKTKNYDITTSPNFYIKMPGTSKI